MAKVRQPTRRRWPPRTSELDALIEDAILDAYGESEQRAGFYTMLEQHLGLPFDVEILGITTTVERIDLTGDDQIVAVCRRGRWRKSLPILDCTS